MGSDIVTEGGYDAVFCNPVSEDLQCGICHLPFCNPLQLPCGHQFCKACWEKYIKTHDIKNLPCPMDRQRVKIDRVFPDKAAERRVLSLMVKCKGSKSGDGEEEMRCDWTGELRSLADHAKSCPYELVCCPNDDCFQCFQRRYLENHLTLCDYHMVTCKCTKIYLRKDEKHHYQTCMEYPLECTNKCGETNILRKQMKGHLKICPLAALPCTYAHIGCKFTGIKDIRDKHEEESTKEHLLLSANYIHVVEEKNRSLEARVSELESTCNTGYMIWTIEGYRGKVTEAKQSYEKLVGLRKIFGMTENFYSKPFMTNKCGYKLRMCANFYYTGEAKVAFGVQLMKGKYDAILEWPFNLQYEIALLSHHGQELKKKACLVNPLFNLNYSRPVDKNNCPCFPMTISPSAIEKGNFVVDDTMYVRCVILKDKLERSASQSPSTSSSSKKKRKFEVSF